MEMQREQGEFSFIYLQYPQYLKKFLVQRSCINICWMVHFLSMYRHMGMVWGKETRWTKYGSHYPYDSVELWGQTSEDTGIGIAKKK